MKWTAVYTEDRIFHSRETSWNDLPEEGVLIVIEYQPSGRRIIDGGDWYWMEDGQIHYLPSVSWEEEWGKPVVECSSCVKKGARVPDGDFFALYEKVRRREII